MRKNETRELLTIGYEGREIGGFIDQLKAFNISRLIDVRERPLSRKRGFSKTALKNRLEDANIEYTHIKALGSPTAIRNKLKSDRDYEYFFKAYEKHLSQQMDVLEEIYKFACNEKICFMCFERLAQQCHRSSVAKKIKEYAGDGLTVKHI